MSYIITYTGHKFDFDSFTKDDFILEDIAHSLAMLCRFTGHCKTFYSVGMHSILVADMLEGTNPELVLEGLLHDASEAYINDLSHPLKHSGLMNAYNEYEDRVEKSIAEAFGLVYPFPKVLADMDQLAVQIEGSLLVKDWGPIPDGPTISWWKACIQDLQETCIFPSDTEKLLLRIIRNQLIMRSNKA